ncbi:MAG: tetratricopeptide repeat protein [Myxococcota bacterium]|nr:tetratricopeptide repeat protein [Myxococcota bacterium]
MSEAVTLEEAISIAMEHQKNGNRALASRICKQILDLAPNTPEALHLLGIIQLESTNYTEAIDLLNAAAEADPDSAAISNNLGNAYMGQENWVQAKLAYQQAIVQQPDYSPAYNNLGLLFKKVNQLQKATSCFQKAIACSPSYEKSYSNLGGILLDLERYEESVEFSEKALAINPKFAIAKLNLALASLALKQTEKAIKYLDELYEDNPNDGNILNAYGQAYESLKQKTRAMEYFREASLHDASQGIANLSLGHLHRQAGELKPAIDCYAQAAHIPSTKSESSGWLVRTLLQNDQPEEALKYCQTLGPGVEEYPHGMKLKAFRCIALSELGQTKELREIQNLHREILIKDSANHGSLNHSLAEFLSTHPSLKTSQAHHATRLAFHSSHLHNSPEPCIKEIFKFITAQVEQYLAHKRECFKPDKTESIPSSYLINLWAIVMKGEGHQIPHIHPSGYLSGVYYVQAPPLLEAETDAPPAHLVFGQGTEDLYHHSSPETLTLAPKPGRLVIFPSHFWHHTVPFNYPENRISLAFDVVPQVQPYPEL